MKLILYPTVTLQGSTEVCGIKDWNHMSCEAGLVHHLVNGTLPVQVLYKVEHYKQTIGLWVLESQLNISVRFVQIAGHLT